MDESLMSGGCPKCFCSDMPRDSSPLITLLESNEARFSPFKTRFVFGASATKDSKNVIILLKNVLLVWWKLECLANRNWAGRKGTVLKGVSLAVTLSVTNTFSQ